MAHIDDLLDLTAALGHGADRPETLQNFQRGISAHVLHEIGSQQAGQILSKTIADADQTVLHAALQHLVDCGVPLDGLDEQGLPPIHQFVLRYMREQPFVRNGWRVFPAEPGLSILVQGGANPRQLPNGISPLGMIMTGSSVPVRELIAIGVPIDTAEPEHGACPIHLLAYNADEPGVRELLTSGAQVNALDAEGQTPLHYACSSEQHPITCMRTLLEYGANPNAADAAGIRPLHRAMTHRITAVAMQMLNVLISAGAEVDAVDEDDANAADYARVFAHAPAVAELHRIGIDPSLDTESLIASGAFPHHLQRGNAADVAAMLACNPQLAIEDGDTWPPLRLALRRGELPIVEVLLQYGAQAKGCDLSEVESAAMRRLLERHGAAPACQSKALSQHVDWNNILATAPLRTPRQEAIEGALARVGILPSGLIDFWQRFGWGEFMPSCWNITSPDGLAVRQPLSIDHCANADDIFRPDERNALVAIAHMASYGDQLVYHPSSPDRIWWIQSGTGSDAIIAAGASVWEALDQAMHGETPTEFRPSKHR